MKAGSYRATGAGAPLAARCLTPTYLDDRSTGYQGKRRADNGLRENGGSGWCHGIGNSGARERHSNAGYTTLLFTLEPEEILHFQTTLFLHLPFLSFLPPAFIPHLPYPPSLLPRNSPDLLFSATLVYFPSFRFLGARKAEPRCAPPRSSLPFIVIPEPLSERSRTRKNACTRIDIR